LKSKKIVENSADVIKVINKVGKSGKMWEKISIFEIISHAQW